MEEEGKERKQKNYGEFKYKGIYRKTGRTHYIAWRGQHKMKSQGPLFKKY